MTIPRIGSILLLMAVHSASGQARFEVASIKPSRPEATARDGHMSLRGDRLELVAYTVEDMLDMLNGWQLHRVSGGPDWTRMDRFDIVAKADRPVAEADFKPAVMALLADRFQLKSHTETRDLPGFVIRSPRNRAGFKSATKDETYSVRMSESGVTFVGTSMDALTNYLSQMWKVPVENDTGLEGRYDFILAAPRGEHQPGDNLLRDALEDIGFKVEERNIPIEVTVVDRCERPGQN